MTVVNNQQVDDMSGDDEGSDYADDNDENDDANDADADDDDDDGSDVVAKGNASLSAPFHDRLKCTLAKRWTALLFFCRLLVFK